ncbi:H(+)/Cl(-) exchange transporter ClcA [bacterium]|nr:H(+)/Cl(-) exchange transporter ClcA [bacterium]
MREKILNLYAVSILLGILTGGICSLLQLAIKAVNLLLQQGFHYTHFAGWPLGAISASVSMLMVMIAYLMVKWIAPEASGSGVPHIEGVLLHQQTMHWRRLLPVKFIGSVLAISSKMVLGREGPSIQIGGNLGQMLGGLFRFTPKQCDTLISAGAAAGLAAAFNAPLAGVLFVLEEMRDQFNFSFTNFKAVAICAVMATMVLHLVLGAGPAISMAVYALPSMRSLWLFFILGIVMGYAGLLFNSGLVNVLNLVDKLGPTWRYIYVLIVGLVIGYLAFVHPMFVSGGYEIIEQSLTMNPSLFFLLLVFAIRFVMSLVCYSSGVPGGIFAPMLALGTLLGLAASHVFQWLMIDASVHPGMFAVAGMGALFSASVRAPITGIVLVVEMTQNYSLILPLMVSCLTSTTIVQLYNADPIYTQLMNRMLAIPQGAWRKK